MWSGELTPADRPVDPEHPTLSDRDVDPEWPTIIKRIATSRGVALEVRLPQAAIDQLAREDGTVEIILLPHDE
jgi:hypothetical protein